MRALKLLTIALLVCFVGSTGAPRADAQALKKVRMASSSTNVSFLAIYTAQAWSARARLRAYWRTRQGRFAFALAALLAALLLLNWGLELARDSAKLAVLLGPLGHESFFPY